jgi:hypothetical protein
VSDTDTTDPPGDGGLPPLGEEIHLPGPSLLPLLLAVGITLSLIGVTLSLALTAIGLRWIRSTRADIEELPPSHH